MAATLTPDEQTFVLRMAPHMAQGKSMVDAAAAVLEDDMRLFLALQDRRQSYCVPTPDERGRSYSTNEGKGDLITRELARLVYDRIRKG